MLIYLSCVMSNEHMFCLFAGSYFVRMGILSNNLVMHVCTCKIFLAVIDSGYYNVISVYAQTSICILLKTLILILAALLRHLLLGFRPRNVV